MSTAIADYRAQLKKELAKMQEKMPAPSGNRVGTKGKVFSLPDGTTNPGPLGAVVLDYRIDYAYYDRPYDSQNPQPPVCWAITDDARELKPSPNATKPQAETCAQCEKNKFGSAPTGRAKACKQMRRLAIAPPDADASSMPMILSVSPTATKHFDQYVLGLAAGGEGRTPVEVITQIAFKRDTDYPTLVFGNPTDLPEEKLGTMMQLRQTAQSALDREPEND